MKKKSGYYKKVWDAVKEFNDEYGGTPIAIRLNGNTMKLYSHSNMLMADGDITTKSGYENLMACVKEEYRFHERAVGFRAEVEDAIDDLAGWADEGSLQERLICYLRANIDDVAEALEE